MEPFKRDWGSFGKSIEEEKQTGSKENEGECESSEKELGNPKAGERRRLWHAMYRASTWHASKASADQPFSSLICWVHLPIEP